MKNWKCFKIGRFWYVELTEADKTTRFKGRTLKEPMVQAGIWMES